jgi:hypothetical protein
MNETMSLLLATAILAAGGIGLFMFKSPDDNDYKDDYNEEDIILDELEDLDEYNDDYEEDCKPRSKGANKNKTKRNRKSGGSRRRY